MINNDVFEQMQNMSSMYLASNKELQCNTSGGIDIRDIRLFEVTNQTYDTISKNLYAIENVLDAMQSQNVTYVYLIQGTGTKIHYYYGVAPLLNANKQMSNIPCDIKQGEDVLVANFEVNYPGSSIVELTKEKKQILHQELLREQTCAVLEGVPGVISSSSTTLGMDRFVNVMEHETFLVMVLAEPLSKNKVKEIVCEQQAVLDLLTPLIEYSKVNQQSNVNELSSLVDRSRVNTRSKTNTSSEQLQFQLFATTGSVPLKLGKDSLQQIEDLFFDDGVANNDLFELMNALLLHQQREITQKDKHIHNDTSQHIEDKSSREVANDSTVTPPVVNNRVVTTQQIKGQESQKDVRFGRRRNTFANPFMRRNNQSTKRSNMRSGRAFAGSESEYKITEENVIGVGDKIMRYLDNSDSVSGIIKENSELLKIQETVQEDIDSDFEELAVDLLEGQNEFTLASINRQDSRAKAKVKSCSVTNRVAANMREACTNICSVTERYTNQSVSSWNRYLIDIVNSRLQYGENRGIYVCSTMVFAGNDTNLTKVVAAWRGMNEYDTVSKVPITESIIQKKTNQYSNIVNFQIPKYFYGINNRIAPLSQQEILARSAYSQFTAENWIYGGNWISSKELRHMITLPLKSTCKAPVKRNDRD